MENYKIENTIESDLDFVCYLFDEAIAYQKRNGYPVWKGYDKEVIKADMRQKLHYKITKGNDILCAFSVCYNDPVIWREMDNNNAIYLHRIVGNPRFKGQNHFGKIFNWANVEVKNRNLKYLRLDTWADNPKMINYYRQYGFKIVETFTTPDTQELPVTGRNINLVLLEFEVKDNRS